MDIEIKSIDDLQKAYDAMKKDLETKGAENVRNFDEKITAIETAITKIKDVKPEVTAQELTKVKEDLATTVRALDIVQARVKNQAGSNVPKQDKTFEDVLKEAVEKKTDEIEKFNRKEIKRFEIELDMKTVGALSTANVTGATWGYTRRPGIIMNPNTRQHVRDLLNVQAAGPGTDYYFMHEEGEGEGSIAATSETTAAAAATTQATGLKPQFDLDLKEESVKFEIIAGWMLMSRKAMKNIPGILGFLNTRIPEKLLDAEDQYLLYGTGTSPQIKGILAAGNHTASTSSSTVLSEAILDDISLLEDTYKRIANGIVMRPANYWSFFKQKAAGSGEYDLPQGVIFSGGTLYLWGIPVAKTTALTNGDYVVGDFQNGADLLIQEAIRIEFFEQDATNVRTNQVTIRVEETVAFPVYGATYFVKGSVPAES